MTAITLDLLDRLTGGGKLGTYDVPCPTCGPERRSPANRRRAVLRVWRFDPGFAGYHCARCGLRGHVRDGSAPAPDPVKLARARAEALERKRDAAAKQLRKAKWLWSRRQPIIDTVAEIYLREARGYHGAIPRTLAFLPSRGEHGPAMIAPFGLANERQPGVVVIADDQVSGVHITRLTADGSGKAGTERDKIMIGSSLGSPIVLAPANDLLGLAITEGVEDALSVHEATGLGAWAAGAASRLPSLADAIPTYVETISLLVDDDEPGRHHAAALAERAAARGFQVRRVFPSRWRTTA